MLQASENSLPFLPSGTHSQVLIVGAGPAGLALAQELRGLGGRVTLVEQAPLAALSQPAFDGREIALTQRSVTTLQRLGAWERIPPEAISPLRDAKVMDGVNPFAMVISHQDAPVADGGKAHTELGFLVGNHHIRQALFEAVFAASEEKTGAERPVLISGKAVKNVQTTPLGACVTLDDGTRLTADLLVAADSRHSGTRRALGLAADLHDFGRSMLVCHMTHDEPHHHAAWEWFDYGQTLALLPMNDCPQTGRARSSVVLTLPSSDMHALEQLAPDAFNTDLQRRFANRLGRMELASTRHVYPLVAVYPRRLVGPRLACVGDAACGMHPVTAHGFNLGLRSTEALAQALAKAQRKGQAWHDPAVLAAYERTHWLASRPTYLATQWITRLYTAETPLARLARQAALRLGWGLVPFRRAVAASLTGV